MQIEVNRINFEAKKTAEKLEIDDSINQMQEAERPKRRLFKLSIIQSR